MILTPRESDRGRHRRRVYLPDRSRHYDNASSDVILGNVISKVMRKGSLFDLKAGYLTEERKREKDSLYSVRNSFFNQISVPAFVDKALFSR